MGVRGMIMGAAAALLSSTPAYATGSISCTDMKQDSAVDILLGAGPVSNVLRVTIVLGERQLTTDPGGEGERVTLAQAFDDGETFLLDLVDEQASERVAVIRLLKADHAEMPLQLGFVQLGDDAPVGLSCIGP